jgi:proline dehydrogenase
MLQPQSQLPDFNNTAISFQAKSNAELRNSYILFKAIGYNWLVKIGPTLINAAFALKLPIKGLIKNTIFKQFCGGESINDCDKIINLLYQFNIGTILDYSVEGEEREDVFDATAIEIIKTIEKAKGNVKIPFCVFKTTGIARFALLEKVSANEKLTPDEFAEFERVKNRVNKICGAAFAANVRIFIDAEESWIQTAIDDLADNMMAVYNKQNAIVFNTIQLYRHDRLEYLKKSFNKAQLGNYYYGVKLVRGAYMEKERKRALEMGYIDPIQPNKEASDRDYDLALKFCVENINRISICAGTHNDKSCLLLVKLLNEYNISKNDKRVYFSQLFGMSDHLSFNLSNAGYNVAKYLPYGPVQSVLPYLFRRAQENTSVAGQAGRELVLITKELQRRKQQK